MKSPKSFGKPKRPRFFVVRRVRGLSMLPALRPGQVVLGRRVRLPKAGSVVVVSHGGLEKIKRVKKIEAGKLYVLGDNRTASTDSRDFGWLPEQSVVAKIVWPRL